jgi:hypothetical protein
MCYRASSESAARTHLQTVRHAGGSSCSAFVQLFQRDVSRSSWHKAANLRVSSSLDKSVPEPPNTLPTLVTRSAARPSRVLNASIYSPFGTASRSSQGSLRSTSGPVVFIISFSYFREAPPVCFAIKPGSYPIKRMAVRSSFITRRRRVPLCLRLAHQLVAARQMAKSSCSFSR